jgi:7,8-dihydropterin-6-yl-methyl-4-(beta-D-ribofuranosyl)aminobenzene 5'-phosphate synthase
MKDQWSKLFVVTAAFLLLASACVASPPPPTPTALPPSPTPDPAAPVHAWADALNSGDVDTMLALFTDDAQYRLFFDATGKVGLRGVFNWLVGLKAKNEIGDCQQPKNDRVMCDLTVVDDCIAAFGAPEGLAAKGTYIFREDGKIQQVVGAQEGAGWDGYWKWVDEVFAWQRTNRAEESAKADYSFGKDGGAAQIKLCKEYGESLKATPTAKSDLTAPVKAWVDALNSGDVDAALAPFTDDVKFLVFEYYASNKDELRAIFDWLAGLETKYQVTECQPKDGGVVCTMPVVDACIAGFGATDGLPTKMEFSFQEDGKISKVSGNLEGGEWNNYFSKWVYPGTSWMRANRPDESAKVDAAANRREAGAIQTKLCKLYGESLKSALNSTPEPAVPAEASPGADNKGDADAALGDLKLTILFDNTAIDPRLKSGWGFAALVEYSGHTLLFDTGADGSMLLDNMRQLDVDPQSIEAVIFSHEHGDHTQGLQALLDTGVRPTVYAPSAFSSAFKEQVRARTELVEVTDPLEILPGMHLTRPVGSIVEQALAVETRDGTVVITGCAHPGIANMVRQAQEIVPGKVSLLAGGFHLLEIADKAKLQSVIAELRQLGVERILPTHCTGDGAIDLFRTEFGENYLDGGVGRTVASSAAGRAALPAPASTPLPTAVGTGGAGDPPTVVQAYHAAISGGDVDAALSLLTDDVKLRGVYYGTGKEALSWIFDWLVGQETKYGPADCQTQAERVVCAFTVSDACIAAYGATGGLPWKGVYVIGQDGKIQEASESKEGTSWDDYDKWARTVDTWIANNRADERPADGMNKEAAVALAKFCKEYAASLK